MILAFVLTFQRLPTEHSDTLNNDTINGWLINIWVFVAISLAIFLSAVHYGFRPYQHAERLVGEDKNEKWLDNINQIIDVAYLTQSWCSTALTSSKGLEELVKKRQRYQQHFALYLCGGSPRLNVFAKSSLNDGYCLFVFGFAFVELLFFNGTQSPGKQSLVPADEALSHWLTVLSLLLIMTWSMRGMVWNRPHSLLQRVAAQVGEECSQAEEHGRFEGQWRIAKWVNAILEDPYDTPEQARKRREVVILPILKKINMDRVPRMLDSVPRRPLDGLNRLSDPRDSEAPSWERRERCRKEKMWDV